VANALLIAFVALSATTFLFYDPFKTPWLVWHRRARPLVRYSFVQTFLVLLALLEGGWFVLQTLPSGPLGWE